MALNPSSYTRVDLVETRESLHTVEWAVKHVSWMFAGDISVYLAVKIENLLGAIYGANTPLSLLLILISLKEFVPPGKNIRSPLVFKIVVFQDFCCSKGVITIYVVKLFVPLSNCLQFSNWLYCFVENVLFAITFSFSSNTRKNTSQCNIRALLLD